MMDNNQRFNELLESYLSNTATPMELTELMQMIKGSEHDDVLKHKIDAVLAKKEDSLNISPDRAHDILYKILTAEKHTAKLLPMPRPVKRLLTRVAAAAVILLLLSVGGYFYFNKDTSEKQIAATDPSSGSVQKDVAPGKSGAILTLANGQQIILDNAANGKITDAAVKNGNEVSYLNGDPSRSLGTVENNTMTTPRGRQFELVLADGTKAWLDAGSSITYPTVFTGNERKVSFTGQVYFEVAKNDKKPFIVEYNSATADRDMSIQVLGTHFNVNAYDDEVAIKTTLLEGSVKITPPSPKGVPTILKPGQQAQVTKSGDIKVSAIDVDQAVAWKNGFFSMKKTDMQTFMRMISRWYDVDVVYEGAVPTGTISGEAQRSLTFSQMQKVLQLTDINFKIEGKKLIVRQ